MPTTAPSPQVRILPPPQHCGDQARKSNLDTILSAFGVACRSLLYERLRVQQLPLSLIPPTRVEILRTEIQNAITGLQELLTKLPPQPITPAAPKS